MTFFLLVGGGAYLGISNMEQLPVASPQALVVHDLQHLDSEYAQRLAEQQDAAGEG